MAFPPELEKLIQECADDVRELVTQIENDIQTTENHYGRYLTIISRYNTKAEKMVVGLALIRSGANKTGVTSAMKLAGAF